MEAVIEKKKIIVPNLVVYFQCKECGIINRITNKFCVWCGKRIRSEATD